MSVSVKRYLNKHGVKLPREVVERWLRLGADIEVIDGYPNIFFEPRGLRIAGDWNSPEFYENVKRLLESYLLGNHPGYYIDVCPLYAQCFVEEHGGGHIEFLVIDRAIRKPILIGGLEFQNESGSTKHIDAKAYKITLDTVIPEVMKKQYY
jgi:hypothetical protein